MNVTWLGHACFLLEAEGYCIIIDPYQRVEGYPDISAQAHAVYCSHEHFDHSYRQGVTLLPGRESPFTVEEVPSFHDGEGGALRGANTIRVFAAEGVRVCHLGDLGHLLSPEQIAAIGHVDVLLIPVGGTYTIGPEEAKAVIRQIRPIRAVPMHYRHGTHGLPAVGGAERFLELFCSGSVITLPGADFRAEAGTLPTNADTEILVPACR